MAPRRDTPRLFGRFLLEHRAVEPQDLVDALRLMASMNETVGGRAVARGWLTRAQADHIAQLQRTIDARWGDIAVALTDHGLTETQLEQLLWEQSEGNLRIGDALVEVGALSCSEAEAWMARYEGSCVPDGVVTGDASAPPDPARYAVDGLPRVMLRRAGVHAACASPRPWQRPAPAGGVFEASVTIGGTCSTLLGLSLSPSLARALTRRSRGTAKRVIHDLLEVLAAYVARRVELRGEAASALVGPVHDGPLPDGGLAFTLLTDFGEGTLVVDRRGAQPTSAR